MNEIAECGGKQRMWKQKNLQIKSELFGAQQ